MSYIYHNTKSDEYYLFGSQPTMSEKTGVSLDTLKTKFSREKLSRWDNEKEGFVIVKLNVTKR